MKRNRKSLGPFVALPKAIMATPAWRAMTFGARLLWIEMRGWLRNDRLNNGKQHLSCRDAAEAIGADKSTVARWFVENEHYGFLRKTAAGFLGSDGRGIAAKYRFTDLAHGTHPATRDYEKWDGVLFEGRPKKQNPVRKKRTPRTQKADIRKGSNEGSVCTQKADIGESAKCTQKADQSRLPSQSEREEGREGIIQGSLTVRAPVQAGGAGSSPAPVAQPLQVSPELEQLIKSKSIRGNGGGRLTAGSSTWHSALRWRQW
jgi:hypothetical protein